MPEAPSPLKSLTAEFLKTEEKIRHGGGKSAIDRQHEKGRLTARERIDRLIDKGSVFQEYGLWAAHGMYAEHGGAPAAGVVTGIGIVQGHRCMIIANDATVKAGAFFPMTCKKIIRAQTIAMMARLPLIYLVDSAGVFLPMQEDVFPDTDDFGRIFRNNAVISAEGIPQLSAIMGYCVAGGGYLPVLCDTLIMTEGSGLYLAGPALVKAAIGQAVTDEELGGAEMHASISGTIDFKEKDDDAAIARLRSLMSKYGNLERNDGDPPRTSERTSIRAYHDPMDLYAIFNDAPGSQYDVRDIIGCIVDAGVMGVPRLSEPRARSGDSVDRGSESRGTQADRGSESRGTQADRGSESRGTQEALAPDFDEYKPDYGQSIVCGYGRIGGHPVGIVANQKKLSIRQMPGGKAGPSKATNMPGVIYDDSADKSARFIMDCNQRKIPIIFLHDTTGFMVGRDSEQGGIIRAGAKMVNAMANCIVPKLVVILGGSYGAGNYAMCGRAFDPFISFAWPSAKCAVMGAAQATGTLAMIEEKSRERKGEKIDPETHKQILDAVRASYNEQQDIRHGAARGWLDRIIEPHKTREELIAALDAAAQNWDYSREFKTGVLQT